MCVCVCVCVCVYVCECVDGLTKKQELFDFWPMTPIRAPSPDIFGWLRWSSYRAGAAFIAEYVYGQFLVSFPDPTNSMPVVWRFSNLDSVFTEIRTV